MLKFFIDYYVSMAFLGSQFNKIRIARQLHSCELTGFFQPQKSTTFVEFRHRLQAVPICGVLRYNIAKLV
jgi:hypothetical protein